MGWNDHETHRRPTNVHWTEQSEQPHSPKDLREVVDGLVEVTSWHREFAACLCPACQREDGRLWLGRYPTVSCFSAGCADFNRQVNAELVERTKQACGRRGLKIKLTREDKAEIARRKDLQVTEAQARNRLLPEMLKRPGVPLEEWQSESPYPLAGVPVSDHWKLLISGLYEPDTERWARLDWLPRIWVGYLEESGGSQFAMNFKTRTEWLAARCPYGPQISVCVFKPYRTERGERFSLKDMGSRSKQWVLRKDYLVAESDVLSREQFGHVLHWIKHRSVLRALVDTGGKSLHGWFELPGPPELKSPPEARWSRFSLDAWRKTHPVESKREDWEQAKFWRDRDKFLAILKGLTCDPNMFRWAATARLPGVERLDDDGNPTGRMQRLLYFDPKYPVTS